MTGCVSVCVYICVCKREIESLFCLCLCPACAVCVCEASAFWDLCPCQSLCVSACVCEYMCVLLTAVWFIPSFSGVAVWGPLCVMPMRRGLYVIEVGLWKPPAIWTPAALDVCLSIRQFLLIAQSQDSVQWLSIKWFLHRLNTLISNKAWDRTNPWPWDWPDNAELGCR